MNSTKQNVRRVFWLYLVLFTLIIFYIVKMVVFDNIPDSPYNQRISRIDAEISRGLIYDTNGLILAETIKNDDSYVRKYPYSEKFAHVVGYLDKGKYGLELSANFRLQTLKNEIAQRIDKVVSGEDLKGNDVYTTLNGELQMLAYDLLGTKKGGIVALEPSTGRILSMVSYPNFDPNTINADWNSIVEDAESSALVNRATQGLYPPGSVFKILTAATALMNEDESYGELVYECKGKDSFGGYTINCYDGRVHGEINMQQALTVSCNCYFAYIGDLLGASELKRVGELFLFNKHLPYELSYNESRLLTDSTTDAAALAQTSIGQGKTVVSPLQIALLGAVVANSGILMKPYLIEYEKSFNGTIYNKQLPEKVASVIPSDVAFMLKDMMVSVVENGTGTSAKINGISVAGKTGTAQNEKIEDHAWFLSFAPADNPQIVVAVILENGGAGSNAAPIAKKIMEQALK